MLLCNIILNLDIFRGYQEKSKERIYVTRSRQNITQWTDKQNIHEYEYIEVVPSERLKIKDNVLLVYITNIENLMLTINHVLRFPHNL